MPEVFNFNIEDKFLKTIAAIAGSDACNISASL